MVAITMHWKGFMEWLKFPRTHVGGKEPQNKTPTKKGELNYSFQGYILQSPESLISNCLNANFPFASKLTYKKIEIIFKIIIGLLSKQND